MNTGTFLLSCGKCGADLGRIEGKRGDSGDSVCQRCGWWISYDWVKDGELVVVSFNRFSSDGPRTCAVCDSPIKFMTWDDGYRRFKCGSAFNPKNARWTKSCRRAFDVALGQKARLNLLEGAGLVGVNALNAARSQMSYAQADSYNIHTAINQLLAALSDEVLP